MALRSDMGITAQEKMTGQAVKTLMKSAKKHHVMVVMSLALNVKLDAFDKAKKTWTRCWLNSRSSSRTKLRS